MDSKLAFAVLLIIIILCIGLYIIAVERECWRDKFMKYRAIDESIVECVGDDTSKIAGCVSIFWGYKNYLLNVSAC